MHTEDTIAALSTPVGHSGIGIIRLSGKDSIKIADTIFVSPKKKRLIHSPSHRIHYGHIINPDTKETVDEVLVSVMKAPHTYTKDNIVEINCHGGPVPLRRTLDLVLSHGARLAAPGEFTKRAFLNGRIDLAQAEAVLDVINALTTESQKTALLQLRGRLSGRIQEIKEELIELTALVEAHIDFPDEEIAPLSLKDMKERARTIQKSLKTLIHSSRYGIILREGVKTAIIGRPNVGKSSLLNALLNQDKAIVTEIPGTTRDVIEEYLSINGIPIRVMDTAGIRHVRNKVEKEGVKRSIQSMKDADLILLVLDGSQTLTRADRDLIEKSPSHTTLLVINKIDLPQKIALNNARIRAVRISAKKGTGIEKLKNTISTVLLSGKQYAGTEIVTNMRHVCSLERTLTAMNAFMDGVNQNVSPEFLSVELREALDAVGDILGVTTTEEILNRIFDNFCIGK